MYLFAMQLNSAYFLRNSIFSITSAQAHSVWKSPQKSLSLQHKQKELKNDITFFENQPKSQCLKISTNVSFSIFAFPTNFCPIKIDLSSNTVWLQASALQELVKLTIF